MRFFLLFVGEDACSVSSLCKGFVVEQMDWEKYIKNRKRKLSQEETKHSNLERENKMLWPPLHTNCVFPKLNYRQYWYREKKVFYSKPLWGTEKCPGQNLPKKDGLMCALWRIHPSNLSIPVQHNWSWSVSFHQNVHQFSGGRDCRQDHKYLLKGCFVCERFKYWQVSKTCIIWIVHGKLSQLLLRKSSPGRLSRPLIKPTLSNFSKRSFQHNFHEQKKWLKSQKVAH